ncbi:hypothetical protein CKO31_07425 [Thiohalocapsa halophila]|uniref:Uncharacterized protein n=1 Tax=Thiohalocapsa halophila TaxID=69359 RepID=A0ABS1CF82_9GAMM|nr:hypothetical protein [Thiohalocapsa halophila]MBK1630576.1 hypothetical protein [Thiohalocapsa halophila]
MSAPDRSFAHAQARVQARYGRLPTENDWRRISGIRGLGAWLEDARNGPHRDWVKAFSAASTAADIEAGVRGLLLTEIDAVADFVPESWRDAVRWTRWLALAGVIEHLRRGGALPAWARQAAPLAALLDDDGALVEARVAEAGLAPLLDPAAGPVPTLWTNAWRRRWPHPGAAARADLDGLAGLLGEHLAAFRTGSPQRAWTRRQALRERLRFRFHGLGLSPAAPFTYLALLALDLERLRRALLDRALFPQVPAAGSREEAA